MKLQKFFVLCILLGFICGCSIIPERPAMKVNYYDLGTPEKKIESSSFNLTPGKIGGISSYTQKMVFRDSENQLHFDECNRWFCPPEEMLKAYMTDVFSRKDNLPSGTEEKKFIVSASILRLDGDLNVKTANFTVKYEVADQKTNIVFCKVYSKSIQLEDMTASAFAKGIATAVYQTLVEMNEELKKNK